MTNFKKEKEIYSLFSIYGFNQEETEKIIISTDEQILRLNEQTIEQRFDNLINYFTSDQMQKIIKGNPRVIVLKPETLNERIKIFNIFNNKEKIRIFTNAPRLLTQANKTTKEKIKVMKSFLKDDHKIFICYSPRILLSKKQEIIKKANQQINYWGFDHIKSKAPYLVSHTA